VLFMIFANWDSWVGLFSSLLVLLLLFLKDLPPALELRAEMTGETCSDVASSSLRCFVLGGAASDSLFPQPPLFGMLGFLEVEADLRLCGVKDLLGLLGCLCLGLLVLLLLIESLGGVLVLLLLIENSFSLPLPIFLPSHFDVLLGVDPRDLPNLDFRGASGSSLRPLSSRRLSAPLS